MQVVLSWWTFCMIECHGFVFGKFLSPICVAAGLGHVLKVAQAHDRMRYTVVAVWMVR